MENIDIDAMDVAAVVISTAVENETPIGNLTLQKILYFLQKEYMKLNYGEPLFFNYFEAWKYGPAIPEVYWSYSIWGGSPIKNPQTVRKVDIIFDQYEPIKPLPKKEEAFVVYQTKKWLQLPFYKINQLALKKGTAWSKVFKKQNRGMIPISLIFEEIKSDYNMGL